MGPSEEDRKAKVLAMTHEERLAYAKRSRSAGMGMIVAGIGCFAGVTGGLWNSMGAGVAIAVGFGTSIGLISGSNWNFAIAKEALKWDAEAEQNKSNKKDEVDVEAPGEQ